MSKRVLLIHDDSAPRTAISSILTANGFEVDAADASAAGRVALDDRQFDLVVLKTNLANLDGPKIIQAMRAGRGPNSVSPVLGLTREASDAHIGECWRSGMNALLSTPAGPRQLVEKLRGLGFVPPPPAEAPATPPQPPADAASSLEVFKVLSSDQRLRLFAAIARAGEATATVIAPKVSMSRALAVYHAKPLRKAKLVEARKQGKDVLFTVRTQQIEAVARWMLELAERPSAYR
jgi:CheY-like chemotaxis protein